MRTAFIDVLCQVAERDHRLWLLCGDLGYSVLERFAGQFPDRFVNVGVAEQNMTGIAAGLALEGNIVFTYSIANFPVMRCLEQIRNDVCYHNLNVKIVAVGGGLAYGAQGYTHHAVEDLAVMRVLPNMTVLAPGDPVEARLAVEAVARHPGPCYLRLGKAGEPTVHTIPPRLELGKAICMQTGHDMTLISTGSVLRLVAEAARLLTSQGYSPRVLSMPTLYPIDREALLLAGQETARIVTVEEHGLGGLHSAVAEVLAEAGVGKRVVPVRLMREPLPMAGSQDFLRSAHRISLEGILAAAKNDLA
jgi:transketolase